MLAVEMKSVKLMEEAYRNGYNKAKNDVIDEVREIANNIESATTEWVYFRTLCLFMYVMHDKFGFGTKRLQDLLHYMGAMAETITENYVTMNDIVDTLNEEVGHKIFDKAREEFDINEFIPTKF